MTGTTSAATTIQARLFPNSDAVFTGSLGSIEQGAFATPVVTTAGAAVTRAADVASITGLASLSGSFSVVGQWDVPATGPNFGWAWGADDGTANNRDIVLFDRTGPAIRAQVDTGGMNQAFFGGPNTAGGIYKAVARVETDNISMSVNGGAVSKDTNATLPFVTVFRIGSSPSGNQPDSYIKSVALYGSALSDAQLQTLAK